ncbi:MAG: thiamine pyrophosphate-binding protein [Deltaproteobacteria bacterium]|nr:thiamine pyrophosphate-binding protein [Deltaproteobacteria bacterium]
MLLITSSRRQGITYPDRGGAYQYFDQVGTTRGMTKWSGAVPSFERVPELMRRAFRISYRGRPGVVHIDIPESVFNGVFEVEALDVRAPSTYRRTDPVVPSPAQVQAAARLLRAAERPVIHAGGGVLHAGAFEALGRVAEALQSPVTTSWGARDHELGGARRVARHPPAPAPDLGPGIPVQGAQRSGCGPGGGLPTRRDRLVGETTLLGPSRRATDGAGGHRRGDPGHEPGHRGRGARGRRGILGGPCRGTGVGTGARDPARAAHRASGRTRGERPGLPKAARHGPGEHGEPHAQLPRARCVPSLLRRRRGLRDGRWKHGSLGQLLQ